MDCLTFISNLIDSLVWPAVTLLIVYWLKDAIAERIKNLKTFKWGDKEATFGDKLAEVEAEAEAAQLPPPKDRPDPPVASSFKEYLQRLAEVSPQAAVLEAWKEVEKAAEFLCQKISGEKHPAGSAKVDQIIADQFRLHRLSVSVYTMYRQLKQLRNEAAHNVHSSPTKVQALEYAEIALQVADALTELGARAAPDL